MHQTLGLANELKLFLTVLLFPSDDSWDRSPKESIFTPLTPPNIDVSGYLRRLDWMFKTVSRTLSNTPRSLDLLLSLLAQSRHFVWSVFAPYTVSSLYHVKGTL